MKTLWLPLSKVWSHLRMASVLTTMLSCAVLTAVLATALSGCKTAEPRAATTIESIDILHDTLRVTDTLRVREMMTDSVRYIMTERIKYRDRIVYKRDTLHTHDTRTIVEKEKSSSAHLSVFAAVLIICLAFICRR